MTIDPTELRAASDYFGFLRTELVEKDWRVTRTIAALALLDAAPFRLVFAGGTFLARAYKLVQRMSEDVDFKVVALDPAPVSRGVRRKQLATLRDQVAAVVDAIAFAIDGKSATRIRSRNENHYIVYQLPYTPGSGEGRSVLRPAIQIELTCEPLRQSSTLLPVQSLLAEAFGREPEVPAIACVGLVQTAAEKLVSLTRRTAAEIAGVSRDPDPMLVRHIHDLHALRDRIDMQAAITLARSVALADGEVFKNQYPAYLADVPGETRKALDALRSDPAIRRHYDAFLAAMVYGEAVEFDTAMETVSSWVDAAWPPGKQPREQT